MESPTTPEKCTICLGQMDNRAVVEGCLHAFCYSCLKEWSKIKAVCPLCKHEFSCIMYNIRANDDYDKYIIPKPLAPLPTHFNHLQNFLPWEHNSSHLFDHWMSSRIHEWRERMKQDQENNRAAILAATSTEVIRRRRKYYRERIQVSHVKNNKHVRDISSRFFRDNLPQTYRLVPWLKRELIILFGSNNMMLVNRLCDVIMSALPTLGIRSVEFYDEIKPFLMERTDHFLKEFISFATSPHDISTYDRNARYLQANVGSRVASWSSDEDGVSPPVRFIPHLYNTSQPEPPPLAHMRDRVPLERRVASRFRKADNARKKESVSQPVCITISSGGSSSDESSVEFVRYIKPPHLRTPDAVINLSSGEEDRPGPSRPVQYPNQAPSNRSSSSDDSEVQVKIKSVVVPVDCGESPNDEEGDHRKSLLSRKHCKAKKEDVTLLPSSRRRPFKKIFERKRLSPNNAFARRMPHRWSSESDDDYASPYIPPSRRKRKKMLNKVRIKRD